MQFLNCVWPGRWAATAKALESVDWPNFRQNPVLMTGIESIRTQAKEANDAAIQMWLSRCRRYGVPDDCRSDSLVGNPPHATSGYTYKSLSFAFFAHRIATHWTPPRLPIRVLEIGGGFGGFAHGLSKRYPIESYTFIDGPPMLELQRYYVSRSLPGLDAIYSDTCDHEVDLVVNFHSLGEMMLADVQRYFGLIHEHLAVGGCLYTVNRVHQLTRFEAYPFDNRWRYEIKNAFDGDDRYVECLAIRT